MSEPVNTTGQFPDAKVSPAYEPPVLTSLGNARELLAGADGSIPDTGPDPETSPFQSS